MSYNRWLFSARPRQDSGPPIHGRDIAGLRIALWPETGALNRVLSRLSRECRASTYQVLPEHTPALQRKHA